MIVSSLNDINKTGVLVKGEDFESHRIVLAKHNVGVSVHITFTKKGSRKKLEYKNHIETVHIVEGKARLSNVINDDIYMLSEGDSWALDKHDPYYLEALTDLKLFCIFSPACEGHEVHDEEGSYD